MLCLKLVPHTISLVYSLDNNVMYLQDGQTPLYIASSNGHIAVVQLLLQMFADVSISKKVCHTLIIHPAYYISFSKLCIYMRTYTYHRQWNPVRIVGAPMGA